MPDRYAPAFLLFCTILFSLTSSASAQRSYDYDEVVEESFKTRPGQTLTLRSDLGSVRIAGASGNEVIIRVIKGVDNVDKRKAQEIFDRFELSFDQNNRGVEIEGEYNRPGNWLQRGNLHVEYEIQVPRSFGVEVQTSGGSIRVAEIHGDAAIKTSGGSIDVSEIDGRVEANTSGGSITAAKIEKNATLHTSGGSITVRDMAGPVTCNTSGGSITAHIVRGDLQAHTSGGGIRLSQLYGAVDARTSGGSIDAELAVQPDGPVTLKTSGGSVTLRMDPGLQADINAEASGGSVRTEVPVEVIGKAERGSLHGTLNGGGPLLTLRSSGGSVNIRER